MPDTRAPAWGSKPARRSAGASVVSPSYTSIDNGVVGEPEIRTRGYQVLSYPSTYTGGAEQAEDPLVIVIHRDELPTLVNVLEHVFDWFIGEIGKRGWR